MARAIVLLALLKGLVLVWLIPPFQAPDEYGHYDYALFLSKVNVAAFLRGDAARTRQLSYTRYTTRELVAVVEATGMRPHMDDAIIVRDRPSFGEARRLASAYPSDDSAEALARVPELNAVFNYPPLYYGSLGLLLRLLEALGLDPVSKYYLARVCSVLLLVLTLVVAARGFENLRLPGGVGLATVFALAVHPQLSMMSASVQPDMLALLLVTVALWWLGRGLARLSPRIACGFGATLGLLLLTKLQAVPPIAAAGLATLGLAAGRRIVPPRRAALAVGLAGGVALLVGGWWHVRSRVLYGNWLGLVGWQAAPGASATFTENLELWFRHGLPATFRSYWGVWGWLDYGLPDWTLPVLAAISIVPALLLALRAWATAERWSWAQFASRTRRSPQRLWILALGLTMVLYAVEMLWIAGLLGLVHDQGRQWLAFALPQMLYLCAPIALLTTAGLHWTARHAAARQHLFAVAALLTTMAAVSAAGISAAKAPVDAILEVRMQVSVDSFAEVFYDAGGGIRPDDSARARVRKRDGVTTYRFPVQAASVRGLRLDPMQTAGTARIEQASLVSPAGQPLARLTPADARPATDVTTLDVKAGTLVLETTAGGIDPGVQWTLPTAVDLDRGLAKTMAARVRGLWQRIVHRIPRAGPFPDAWALLTAVAAGLWSIRALGRSSAGPVQLSRLAAHARRTAVILMVTSLLLINAYLIRQTVLFYR